MGFLDEIDQTKLEKMYRTEKEGKAKTRLLALIKRKEGKTYREISDDLKVPLMTVHDWIGNVDDEGMNKIYDQKRSGRPTKLTIEQEVIIKKELKRSPRDFGIKADAWIVKTLRLHIEKNHGVNYSNAHIYRLIDRLEFSLIKPRPRDYRADRKEQEKWKREFKKNPGVIMPRAIR